MVAELRNTVNAHMAKMTDWNEQLHQLNIQLRNGDITAKVHQQKADEINRQIAAAQEPTRQAIEASRRAYHSAVDEWETPSAEKMVDDLKLLSGGIPLGVKDLEALEAKHRNNPLMLKALVKYADDNKVKYYSVAPLGDAKRQKFDELANMAMTAINNPSGLQAAYIQDDKHFEAYFSRELTTSGEV